MDQNLFPNSQPFVSSSRIIYTPSSFARSSLIHLQETGTLKATYPHKSERRGLTSCLFFIVVDGTGRLTYDGETYELGKGDCVFIDCKKGYRHETGMNSDQEDNGRSNLWSLKWCHFYGPSMNAIYRKYQERGGRPVFRTQHISEYGRILDGVYQLAGMEDYVRDMRLHERLSALLTLLMEDAWAGKKLGSGREPAADIQQVKEYLESHFREKITLDELAGRFYINKYYLMALFKERYGVTIRAYLNQLRVTYVKGELRFSDKTLEMIGGELGMGAAYLSRLFKKAEGVSPSEYRRTWRGR